jgi:hypothetical protein
MENSIRQIIASVPDTATKAALDTLIGYLADRLNSVSLTNATLVIKGGSTDVLAATSEVWYGLVDSKLVTLADNTDMAALSGTVAADTFNVFVFYVDSAGTLTSAMGTAATTLAGVKFPEKPTSKTVIGFVIINPTGTGDFVGGTTEIDDGTVVPNAVFVNALGPFDPTFLLTK